MKSIISFVISFILIFTLKAQTIEDNTGWKSSHGNSIINKDSIFLEGGSGTFVDFNFEPCKYYRLLIYSKSSSFDISLTNGLLTSNGVDMPTNLTFL